ncbi:MAG: flagellar basal-body MS-ring/collar protein FliF, partial [Bryobacteraceae bacterium]
LDETGGVVLVSADKLAEARLRIAGAGLPKTGRLGFELFDSTNFGLTEFAEQVNFRRAIEGELERTIGSMSEVERARVHISLPKDSVFLESRQEAKASVVIRLRGRARLSAQNGAAICHLVASAVERLSADRVTVLDTDGNLLVRPRATGGGETEASDASLEYKQKIERDLVQKINSTLQPLLGEDNFRAGVSVECDFSTAEESRETFDPAGSVVLTSQKSEDAAGSAAASGVPGTASNLPNPASRPAAGAGAVSRRTENVSYQPSKTVRRVRYPQGNVKRMSLAVLVDQEVRWEGAGEKARRTLAPPSPEKLKIIRDLVSAATGFSAERGDQLTVESQPFDATLNAEPPAPPAPPQAPAPPYRLPAWIEKYISKMNPALLIGVGVGILLTLLAPLVIWVVVRRRRRAAAAVAATKGIEGKYESPTLSAAENFEHRMAERNAERARLEAEALETLKLPPVQTKKSEVLLKHLKESTKKDPESIAQLVRSWLNEAEI